MSKRIPIHDAMKTARGNSVGRMIGRSGDNRIEPECWPAIKPGFHFSKDQKFFTIGSCFAGNIGRRLKVDGYNVHSSEALPGEQRNRYTPAAIFQEIDWAGRIFHRDGTVSEADVEPLLLESVPGKFVDLWCRPGQGDPVDLESSVERRLSLYNYFKGAFEADVVIITLGLIEAWWDELSESYVELDTNWLRRRDRDRFQFEVLDFATCKDFVRRTLGLLLDGHRRVLITTSPVVLSRTFTDKDIIVANNHSKSLLRAVAGELSDEIDGVDYFPSYEIATISGRQQVWEDDLVHIKPNFVGRIMQHVTDAYVPGSVGDETRQMMHMANLVDAGNFEAAATLYDRVREHAQNSRDPAVQAAGIALAMSRKDTTAAVAHALSFDLNSESLYLGHPAWALEAGRALRSSEQHRKRGEEVIQRLMNVGAKNPQTLSQFFINRQRARDPEGVDFVVEIVEKAELGDAMLAHRACVQLQQSGELDRAIRLASRQLEVTPEDLTMLGRYVRLLMEANRASDAIAPLERMIKVDPDNQWARLALARTLYKNDRIPEALEAIEGLLHIHADHVDGLAFKARVLARLKRKPEAIEFARAAAKASSDDPRVLRSLQSLLAA